ncbi:hypothetical protein SDC9_159349 [bioreactor metagenome]|uniref:Uncharacterized protein n=1 Tax=bioreactor metagenome TaxID=1076179 RepID=A0A645FFB5_9ZZZZ
MVAGVVTAVLVIVGVCPDFVPVIVNASAPIVTTSLNVIVSVPVGASFISGAMLIVTAFAWSFTL